MLKFVLIILLYLSFINYVYLLCEYKTEYKDINNFSHENKTICLNADDMDTILDNLTLDNKLTNILIINSRSDGFFFINCKYYFRYF